MAIKTIKRRRRENKTDYNLRIGLLKSKNGRIVVRRTNKYVYLQLVETKEAQDFVKKQISSKELLKNGWNEKSSGSLKSIPAAYLTGILFAKEVGKGEYNIDTGMVRNVHGSRIYAAIKGMIDGGMKINAYAKSFPSKERLMGEHLDEEAKKIINKVKEKIQ